MSRPTPSYSGRRLPRGPRGTEPTNAPAAPFYVGVIREGELEIPAEVPTPSRTPWDDCPVCGGWPCDEHWSEA